jgi:glycosyltransferase 2 family protein
MFGILRWSQMSAAEKVKSWRVAALRIGGSVAILALLFFFIPFQKLAIAIRSISPTLWLALLCGYLGAHLIGIVKWRLTLRLSLARLTFIQAMRCYFAGLFGTVFLPSIVGGDVVRIGLAFRIAKNRTAVVLGSLVDRILDVLALAAVAGIGALLLPGALDPGSRRIFLTVILAIAAAGIAVLAALVLVPWRLLPFKIRRMLVRLRYAARSMASQSGYVLVSLLLGIVVQLCFVSLSARIAFVCGLRVPFHVWLLVWPLAKILALLPITLGGLGVREAGLAALLAPFGVAAALSVAAGLAWESVIIAGGLVAGLVSFLTGGALSSVSTLERERPRPQL